MGEGKEPIFRYGETEILYLKQRDPKLGSIIDQIGPIERTVDDDLFSAIVHHIVGQQISTKAQQTIWRRMREDLGEINAEMILAAGTERLQGFGMTFKKVDRGLRAESSVRRVGSGAAAAVFRQGDHRSACFAKGDRRVDRRNDFVVLSAAAGCVQLWRSGNPARLADGVSSPENRPEIV